jgi:hypothetical protein
VAANVNRISPVNKSIAKVKFTLELVVGLGVALLVVAGCRPKPSTTTPKSNGHSAATAPHRTDRSDILFSAVVQQLRNLPSYVDTVLTPPMVILDSKSSSDGQDVLATCGMSPGTDEGPINYITSSTHNGHFRSLGVRPGDVLKYYVLYDEESAETGISQTVSMDLNVAQVIDDNSLLVEGGLNRSVTEPAKIEIWRYSDERLNDIARDVATYERYRLPVFDWQPSPDHRVLEQMTERLNQWMRQSPPRVEWSADPLLSTLDPQIAADDRLAPLIAPQALGDSVIQPHEGRLLQEAVWLRDVARRAQGESFNAVAQATAVFDWIVRNIQLDADSAAMPYRPWESLVFGHGTAQQRAWVFALMARQIGLDVVVLEVPADDGSTKAGKSKFWLPALLSDGKLYLFDTRLGLPIPGKDGQGVATLADLQADPTLLRHLDLDDSAYPVSAEQLQHVTAVVVADPFDLSRRAAAIESKLSGDDRLALSVTPTALAEKLKAVPGIEAVKIWDTPFRIIRDQLRVPIEMRRQMATEFEPFAWRPTLWKARVLAFQGRKTGDADAPNANLEEIVDDQAEAIGLYTSPRVRPPDRMLESLASEPKIKIYSAAKDAASFWVGLLLFDQGKFDLAERWFGDPRMAAEASDYWAPGTHYNLARTYEAEGKDAEAIKLYEADDSPQRDGNRLRARSLKLRPQTAAPDGSNSNG